MNKAAKTKTWPGGLSAMRLQENLLWQRVISEKRKRQFMGYPQTCQGILFS